MSDTLTQIIGKVQALLGDDGTIFTTALCTAAVRQALADFNKAMPQNLAITKVGVTDQYEYELTDDAPNARSIIDILLRGTDTAQDFNTSLTFDQYFEDERLFYRLRSPRTTADTIIIRYTENHTISGLDSATESTIQSQHDQILVDGAAFYAIIGRAVSRVESINLSQDQTDNYRETANHFRTAFNLGLTDAARRLSPVSEPDTRAWKDEWDKPSWKI